MEIDYIDMTSSIPNLKAFLHLRDTHPAFSQVKADGRVGLPCVVVNDGEKVLFGTPDLDELR